MFGWLAEYDQVLVTGPQRSGTRICAQMIALDTGHLFVDEADFGVDSLYKLTRLLDRSRRVVVQCPALCRHVHHLAHERMAVVLMRRDVDAIAASQQRIDWEFERVEMIRYDRSEGRPAQVKYDFWESQQVNLIPHAFEIPYESLKQHPLWVPAQLRRRFGAGQINVHQTDGVYLYHSPDVTSTPVENDPALIQLERCGVTGKLNELGTRVWTLCDGTRTQADIVRRVYTQFSDEVSIDQLQADVSSFINNLLTVGYLRVSLNRFDVALPPR
jgi:hypothetical protein